MLNSLASPPLRISEADRITWKLSDPSGDDRKWREKQFAKLPFLFQIPTAKTYKKIFLKKGRTAANIYLREIVGELKNLDIQLATNEDFIQQYVKNRVTECRAVAARAESEEVAFEKASAIAEALGFTPPKICKAVTTTGALARLCDDRWWHRQISNKYPQKFEAAAIRCGMVHAKAGLYVSNESFHAFTARRARSDRILGLLEIENEEGQSYALSELVELSVSNPKNRRNELMARLYGFDLIAKALGNLGLFITITCPSRMHARYRKTGDINPNYNKTTPQQAQKYLCSVWARIRANLKHAGIHIYGFRVAEPQHDGTPHWHILLYANHEHEQQIKDIFLHYALADSPNEKGATKRRCLFETIDWSKGTGIGYMAKYISKNIDGEHIDKDLNGKDAKKSALRVSAWASIHKIRQFQQFGGPSVTCWRELRKITTAPEGLLEEARAAADSGNWELFTNLFGGTQINRKEQPIKPLREFSDECGRYGEPKGNQIVGVTNGVENLVTRIHQWTISLRANQTGMPGTAGLAG